MAGQVGSTGDRAQEPSAHSLSTVLDGVAVAVYTVDHNGLCTGINATATKLLGWDPADCVGKDMHALLHHSHSDGTPYPAQQCPLSNAFREAKLLERADEVFWTKTGAIVSVCCSVTPLSGGGAVVTLNEQITRASVEARVQAREQELQEVLRQRDAAARVQDERALHQRKVADSVERAAVKQLREQQEAVEERLIQSEKLAAMGRLAASISHEINNPLEAVTNLLYLVRHDASLSPEASDYVMLAEQELARVSEIVSQTLRFQRTGNVHIDCQPGSLVESVAALHQGRLRHSNITIQQQHRRAKKFRCAEGDVRQILNNLISNAIDAMGSEGGVITVRTQPANCPRTSRQGTRFTVCDEGHGMTAATAAHIFEPFYTTKGSDGSGLGLWISHSIAQRHGGRLSVRSNRDRRRHGTAFSLFLPDAAPVEPVPQPVQ